MKAYVHAVGVGPERTAEIAAKVETFVRDVIVPYEKDPRRDHHDCPTEGLITELKDKGRAIRGNAASARAKERAASLPRLIDLALRSMGDVQ